MLVSEHIFYSRKPTTKTVMKFFIQQDQNMTMLTIQKLWTVR